MRRKSEAEKGREEGEKRIKKENGGSVLNNRNHRHEVTHC